MAPALVRLAGRRRTIWSENLPLADVVGTEFKNRDGSDDLSPSFHLLPEGATQVIRAHAEHSASHLDTPKGGISVDATGIPGPELVHTPGDTAFAFTRDTTHREIKFNSLSELTAFVSEILAGGATRHLATTGDQLLEYADARRGANDAEWLQACAEHRKAKNWPAQIERLRKKQAKAGGQTG